MAWPDRVLAGEPASGKRRAQDRHGFRPRLVVRLHECAAARHLHAEQRQQRRRDHLDWNTLWIPGTRDGHVDRPKGGNPGEGLCPRPPIVIVEARDRDDRKLRRLLVEDHHVFRPLVGKR